jgi:hypothetical protein
MESNEINPPPEVDTPQENTFRQLATERLLNEHSDMDPNQLNRWMELLEDPDPRARVMASTAVWAMMDVRDNHKRQ